ncbi:platelet binding protein GspB-like [Ptychodera flava]|uniref:platelet binding protein GspB-like n=1 Tax=Ptychodera flava TaxID=63121 RepID=UPI00396A2938
MANGKVIVVFFSLMLAFLFSINGAAKSSRSGGKPKQKRVHCRDMMEIYEHRLGQLAENSAITEQNVAALLSLTELQTQAIAEIHNTVGQLRDLLTLHMQSTSAQGCSDGEVPSRGHDNMPSFRNRENITGSESLTSSPEGRKVTHHGTSIGNHEDMKFARQATPSVYGRLAQSQSMSAIETDNTSQADNRNVEINRMTSTPPSAMITPTTIRRKIPTTGLSENADDPISTVAGESGSVFQTGRLSESQFDARHEHHNKTHPLNSNFNGTFVYGGRPYQSASEQTKLPHRATDGLSLSFGKQGRQRNHGQTSIETSNKSTTSPPTSLTVQKTGAMTDTKRQMSNRASGSRLINGRSSLSSTNEEDAIHSRADSRSLTASVGYSTPTSFKALHTRTLNRPGVGMKEKLMRILPNTPEQPTTESQISAQRVQEFDTTKARILQPRRQDLPVYVPPQRVKPSATSISENNSEPSAEVPTESASVKEVTIEFRSLGVPYEKGISIISRQPPLESGNAPSTSSAEEHLATTQQVRHHLRWDAGTNNTFSGLQSPLSEGKSTETSTTEASVVHPAKTTMHSIAVETAANSIPYIPITQNIHGNHGEPNASTKGQVFQTNAKTTTSIGLVDDVSVHFTPVQQVMGSEAATAFSVDGASYLTMPMYDDRCNVMKLIDGKFAHLQSLVRGMELVECDYCAMDGRHYIIAMQQSMHFGTKLFTYKWNGNEFVEDGNETVIKELIVHLHCFSTSTTVGQLTFISMALWPDNYHLIYTWNGANFRYTQMIRETATAQSSSFFIGVELYLSLTKSDIEKTNPTTIYKFNSDPSAPRFTYHQTLPIRKPHVSTGSVPFHFAGNMYILVLVNKRYNYKTGMQYFQRSPVYVWREGKFYLKKTIATVGAEMACPFRMDGQQFLLVSNHFNGTSYDVNSIVYKFNGKTFRKYDELSSHGATFCQTFLADGYQHILLGNAYDSISNTIPATLYRRIGN